MSDLSNLPRSDDAAVIASMQHWLVQAVIGLNLCPFAKAVHVKNQVKYVVSPAYEAADALKALCAELLSLVQSDPKERDTTLLIFPEAFVDFVDFNDFLHSANKALRKLKLDGELQIASFHPQFQFADAESDDIGNFTNRAPYPTLHLLREASIDKAVQACPDAEQIYKKNITTLRELGSEGWEALQVGPHTAHVEAGENR